MRRCVYCLLTKEDAAFNREHVVPQGFGRFGENLVITCVCWSCNDYFSKHLDLKLGRDTVEGMQRAKVGIIKSSDFKTLGRRGTVLFQFSADGPMRGAYATRVLDPVSGQLVSVPLPQLGFGTSVEGPFAWFLLGELPTREGVGERLGLKAGERVTIRSEGGITPAKLKELLRTVGYDVSEEPTDRPAVFGRVGLTTTGVVDDVHFRGIVKIAMNYVAAVAGPETALLAHFDETRRYVRFGVPPFEPIVVGVDENRWSVTDDNTGDPTTGHYICVESHEKQVVAQVSLILAIRYVAVLARGVTLPAISSGHFFDLRSRDTIPGPPLPLIPPG